MSINSEREFELLKKIGFVRTSGSISTPEGGISTDFVYIEDGLDTNLIDLKGKFALINMSPKPALYKKLTSHNVEVTLEGSKYPEEIISFGAHYDSVPFSTGLYDNSSGSVL